MQAKPAFPTKAKVKRYVTTVKALGLTVSRVECRPSGEVIVHTSPTAASTPEDALTEWERSNAPRIP